MPGETATRAVLNAIHLTGIGAAVRPLFGGIGAILMLHRVRQDKPASFSPNVGLSVSPRFLDTVLARLKSRYAFVSMDEVETRLRDGTAGDDRPFLAVTLDDGYRDNLENAVPVFRKHAVPFTIYVAPGLVDGQARIWWEDLESVIAGRQAFAMHAPKGRVSFDVSTPARKRQAYAELVEFLMTRVDEAEQRRMVDELAEQCGLDAQAHRAAAIMDWREIVELSRDPLCTIGAHTIHHYAIARLSPREALFELEESARIIELETGTAPRHFAFPYGDAAAAGPRDFELAAKAGFATAVTTRHGLLEPAHRDHLHALPRISLNGRFQAMRHVHALLSGLPARLQNRGRALDVS